MPEEIEIDASEHVEHVQHHLHHEPERNWTRLVPLSTAILAVIAAYASLKGGALVNGALLEQGKAVELQAQASDSWAYYQAKGIKANTAGQTADIIAAVSTASDKGAKYAKEAKRYKEEQKELMDKAKELEKQRDEKSKESQEMMHKHHTFAYAVTLAQVAIALSAITAITKRKNMWFVSLAVGAASLVYVIVGSMAH